VLYFHQQSQWVIDSMSTTKEEAMRLISRLPEEVTWEDIIYRLYVKRKIEEGIKAADEGRTVPHDEVKKLFAPE
jgi:predicted transcriptional regulator